MIRIEGVLDANALGGLRHALKAVPEAQRVTVELAGLTAISPEGRGFLMALDAIGCKLIGASLYISRLLEEV